MAETRNILFIMCDQLRWDYLSSAGHPTLETPHIDALAARGVTFERAFVQSPVCGPSRMSFYTGRYMFSHGATWNNVPLPVGQPTMGDHLRTLGLRVALVGKTHMAADRAGMARLGLDPASEAGVLVSQCGFEPVERDDGLWPDRIADPNRGYNRYLRAKGYDGDNPWHTWANSAEGPNGEILSGWQMRNARLPARVREEDSETAYMTDRAIAFVEEQGERPWCLHLSYIKPHWPYIAPAPYHALYGPNHLIPVKRSEAERERPHPVYAAFMAHEESRNFSRPEVRETVVPAYMGLVKQIDDHLGRLMARLEALGRLDDTMIVFTSDHGDYLGDHWLGEKDLFHEESVRIPLILVDPDPKADATRGARERRLVEAIDLLPTFVEALGGEERPHVLEGRSLLPLLRGEPVEAWRDAVYSEYDYAFREAARTLGIDLAEARIFMVRSERWKYLLYEGFRPQLFDLEADPDEFGDLGDSPAHESVRAALEAKLFDWLRHRRTRIAVSDAAVRNTPLSRDRGFRIGVW